jgi:Protein of unknown function (DUF3710)
MFSRNRGSGRHAKVDAARRTRAREPERVDLDDEELDDLDAIDDASAEPPERRDHGPYDVTEAPDGIAQLDLGALLVPAIEGVEVRVQADPDGRIQQVVLVYGDSALQLGVFAAPRTDGIWDEVRAEIRKQLFTDGVAVEEVDGDYGAELRARVRTQEGLTDIRFVGVDGPRWLVRAVYQGPAAVDPSVAEPLVRCLRGVVVDRGQEAMPVREPLPLRLPKEIADQSEGGPEQSGTPTNGAAPGAPRPSPRRKPSPRPRRR